MSHNIQSRLYEKAIQKSMFINVNQTLKYDSALEGKYKINKRTSRLSIFFIDSNLSILSQSFLFGPLNTSPKLRVS